MSFNPSAFTDAFISFNSNTLSDHGNKVGLNCTIVDLDTTAFGQTWVNRGIGGLGDGTIDIDFIQDFAASNLDSIIWALFIARAAVPFEIRPTSSSASTSNPKYTGNVFIREWKPIVGKVGDLTVVSVSWPTSGVVTRATS